MPGPITKYRETIITFGQAPQRSPEPGEWWTMVGDDGAVCAVNFLCPCGCSRQCYTPVTDSTKGQPKSERHWLFSRGPDGPTLSPLVRYTSECKWHFNIENGKVVVHGDSGK